MGVQLRYQYRVYPTPGQQDMLARSFGCARVVFNDCLRIRQDAYAAGVSLSDTAVQKQVVTAAKKTPERAWLGEVASVVLVQACQDARRAYRNWFDSLSGKRKGRMVGAPRLRSRRDNRQTIRLTRNGFSIRPNGKLYVAKVGEVEVAWSRDLPSEPSSVTIIKDAAGRYFASFVVETTDEPLPPVDAEVGIDLGLATFAVLSNGETISSPKFLRRAERKLGAATTGSRHVSRREGPRQSVRRPQGLGAQAFHGDHPREPSGVRRGSVRAGAGADTVGEIGTRRRVGDVHPHAGGESRPLRAHLRQGGPVLSVVADLLPMWGPGRPETALDPGVDMHGVRRGSRPRRQRREEHPRRRTCGVAKRLRRGRQPSLLEGSEPQ